MKGHDLRSQTTMKGQLSNTGKEIKEKCITRRDPQKGTACFKKILWACTLTQTAAHFSQGLQASVSEVLEKPYSLLPAFVGSIDQDLHRQMRTRWVPTQSNLTGDEEASLPSKMLPFKNKTKQTKCTKTQGDLTSHLLRWTSQLAMGYRVEGSVLSLQIPQHPTLSSKPSVPLLDKACLKFFQK